SLRVSYPKPEKAGYAKFPNPASRYALVGVFVAKTAGGVRVAVTGAGSSVFRAAAIEAALASDFSASTIVDGSVPADDLLTDLHAEADYRAAVTVAMARRAVEAANAGV
ncbi:MAG: carbon monoxide dehydrogenase, partial [Pseudomonadota bacterium]